MSTAAVGLNAPSSSFKNERESSNSNPFSRLNWKQVYSTLTQTKDYLSSYFFIAEKLPPDPNSLLFQRSFCPSEDTFPLSEDTDLEVVPDNANTLQLHQIRRTDARHFLELYNNIADGASSLKIVGSSDFKQKILANIKVLMTRPLGRQLIGSICSLKRKVEIREGERNFMSSEGGNLVVHIKLDPTALGIMKCEDSHGKIIFEPMPAFMVIAHELIHALHRDALMAGGEDEFWALKDLHKKSPDPLFTNLSEQMTIAGLDGEQALLSENALRAQFGLPARVAHCTSEFFSYTPYDRPEIDTPNEHGVTRLYNAVIIKADVEIIKLLEDGANPGEAYCAAIFNDDLEMIQFLLDQGMDPHKPDHTGLIPLHLAVQRDKREIVKLLIEGGARVVQKNASGETPVQVALKNRNLHCALLLITNGAPLTQKALECLDPQHRARFLASVPASMNWTDSQRRETEKPKENASKKVSSNKRAWAPDLSESESEAKADLPPKKYSRHR